MKNFYLLFSLIVSFTASASYEKLEGLEVTGKGVIATEPDVFTITLTVLERGISAGKIKTLVDHKSKRLVNMSLALGIKAEDIQSSEVNITPIYQDDDTSIRMNTLDVRQRLPDETEGDVRLSHKGKSKQRKPIIEISRTVRLKIRDLALYDKILDKAVKIGVNRLSPLQMSFSQIENLYQQALDKAILAAKSKALRAASIAGVTLGELTYMKELSSSRPSHYNMVREMRAGFNSNAGTKEVTAQVVALFKLLPDK